MDRVFVFNSLFLFLFFYFAQSSKSWKYIDTASLVSLVPLAPEEHECAAAASLGACAADGRGTGKVRTP
jgi:hypothetical protein